MVVKAILKCQKIAVEETFLFITNKGILLRDTIRS